jgi:hypothetical protein
MRGTADPLTSAVPTSPTMGDESVVIEQLGKHFLLWTPALIIFAG